MPKPKRIHDPFTGRPREIPTQTGTFHFVEDPDDTPQRVAAVTPRRWRRVLAGKETIPGRRIA
jgi:hypothetical protein